MNATNDSRAKTLDDCHLLAIILNYRTPDLVVDCLKTIVGELGPDDKVVVVDSASDDDSVAQIGDFIEEAGISSLVCVMESPENRGFSAGNNLGLSRFRADGYLLLNSDTLIRPGAIQELKRAFEAHPEAGIVSPRLEWPDGEAQISCFRDFSPVSQFIEAAATGYVTRLLSKYDIPIQVVNSPTTPDWTSFAAVLLRREMIDEVGLLDEGYFMYFEDADYCRRARRKGWKVLNWPAARIVHLRGCSSDVKKRTEARERRRRYFYAARTRYLAKFHGWSGLSLSNLLWLAGRALSIIRELLGRRSHLCRLEIVDIWTNWLRPLNGRHGMEPSEAK